MKRDWIKVRTWLLSPMKGLGNNRGANPSKLRKAGIRMLGSYFLIRAQNCFTSLSCFSFPGDPVPDRAPGIVFRPAGDCQIPPQGWRPEQDSHWGLPGWEVSSPGWGDLLGALFCLAPLNYHFGWPVEDFIQVPRLNISPAQWAGWAGHPWEGLWSVTEAGCMGYLFSCL